jgi:hypothetical protein
MPQERRNTKRLERHVTYHLLHAEWQLKKMRYQGVWVEDAATEQWILQRLHHETVFAIRNKCVI